LSKLRARSYSQTRSWAVAISGRAGGVEWSEGGEAAMEWTRECDARKVRLDGKRAASSSSARRKAANEQQQRTRSRPQTQHADAAGAEAREKGGEECGAS
jgi:hypothetical protein